MVVPIRELANIFFSTNSKASTSIPIVQNFSNMEININTNIRGRLTFSSKYSSRKLLTHLNISSIPYYERIEIKNNNPSWSKQIDIVNRERFSLLYAIPKEREVRIVK